MISTSRRLARPSKSIFAFLAAMTDAAQAAHREFDRGDYAAAKASAEAKLAAMKRLPKGVTDGQQADAKSGLAAFDKEWADATATAQLGDLIAALEKGRAAGARAPEPSNALCITAPAEAAPIPQSSAGK